MMKDMKDKKDLWQAVKFMLVSSVTGILQLVLANVLPFVFDGIKAVIPEVLRTIFDPSVLFNQETARGAEEYAKYVVDGVVTWGYVIPFFLSNLLANIYGYFQNKKTTFKSNSSPINFVYYVVIMVVLILFSTWLQGFIVGKLNSTGIGLLCLFSRTIAAGAAGFVQMLVLFPLEKYVLMKEE